MNNVLFGTTNTNLMNLKQKNQTSPNFQVKYDTVTFSAKIPEIFASGRTASESWISKGIRRLSRPFIVMQQLSENGSLGYKKWSELYTRGKNAEAEKLLRDRLALLEQSGAKPIDIAKTYRRLTCNLRAQRKYIDEAEAYKIILETLKKLPDNEEKALFVSDTHRDLGVCFENQGKHKEAEEKYVEALQVAPYSLDGRIHFVMDVIQHLKTVRIAQGRSMNNEGFQIGKKGMAIRIRRYGGISDKSGIRYEVIAPGKHFSTLTPDSGLTEL